MPVFGRRAPSSAKTTLPQAAADVLHRPRLHDRLEQAPVGVWIGAPPAAGKTVLAAASLRRTGRPALWYQVDSGDKDPGAFFHFLGEAAAHIARSATPTSTARSRRKTLKLPHFGKEVGPEQEEFARAWFHALFGQLPTPLTIVIDDWHRLPDDHPLHKTLPGVLDELPAGMKLWVLSRFDAPRSLDGARVRGRLDSLGFADLALRPDETDALLDRPASGRPADAPSLAPQWHHWCDGWVGALVFALAAGRHGPPELPQPGPTQADMAPVLGFLSRELIDQAEPTLRDFMLATAMAPVFSVSLARALCPSLAPVIGPCIEQLVQRHLLVPVDSGREARWRYHRLLREGLLQRARQQAPGDAWPLRVAQVAACLEDAELPESAADWLIEARGWDRLVALLLRHAPRLLRQGRYLTVYHWAEALPEAALTPEVNLAWAGALQARDVRQGRVRFQRAFDGFWAQGDVDGLYRSWCGVIESSTFACDDYGDLAQGLTRLREVRQRFARQPSLRVRAQVSVYGFSAGFLLHPRPPEFAGWLRTVQRQMHLAPRRGDRAAIGGLLALHHAANSGMARLGALLQGLRPLLDDPAVPPFYRLVGGVPDVIHHWIAGDTAHALQRLQVYRQLASESGAHALDTQFDLQATYVHCLDGDLEAADQCLQRVARQLPGLGQLDVAHHHYLSGWRAALSGRHVEARELLQTARVDAHTRRFALLEAVIGGLLSELMALDGDVAAARALSDEALALARRLDSVTALVPCAMHRAAVAEWTDEDPAIRDRHLGSALEAARQHGHGAWGGLLPATLSQLCLRALQRGLEVAHAQALIQRRGLAPPPTATPTACAIWPWPLRVRGLGDLQIHVHEQPVGRGTARASQRPLDLIRALLAQSPRPLPVHIAMQWLWPDADGDSDAADPRKAFDVALLRARRLLGDDSLLRLEGGQLMFDEGRVWTDVGALLELAATVGDAREPGAEQARRWAEQLLALSRGPLLAGEEAPWVQTARERIRRRLAATAERLADLLAEPAPALARDVLQRAFDADPASEPLARRLALTLIQSSDLREAQRVLHLCQSTRALSGEPPVGPDTLSVAEQIRG
jgi:LuxR family transcriptional regulator, maltose regulon positive regulatory protein